MEIQTQAVGTALGVRLGALAESSWLLESLPWGSGCASRKRQDQSGR